LGGQHDALRGKLLKKITSGSRIEITLTLALEKWRWLAEWVFCHCCGCSRVYLKHSFVILSLLNENFMYQSLHIRPKFIQNLKSDKNWIYKTISVPTIVQKNLFFNRLKQEKFKLVLIVCFSFLTNQKRWAQFWKESVMNTKCGFTKQCHVHFLAVEMGWFGGYNTLR
jgi:hypothetical protein